MPAPSPTGAYWARVNGAVLADRCGPSLQGEVLAVWGGTSAIVGDEVDEVVVVAEPRPSLPAITEFLETRVAIASFPKIGQVESVASSTTYRRPSP